MYSWPKISARSRAFEVIAVGLTLVQGALIVSAPDSQAPPVTLYIGATVLLISMTMSLWVVTRLRPWLGAQTWLGALMVAAAAMRAWALLPITYQLPEPPIAMPSDARLGALAVAYAVAGISFAGTATLVSKRAGTAQSLGLAWLGASTVGIMFFVASFGPLPDMPTVLTSRDYLAVFLLAGDLMLLTICTFAMLTSLHRPGGAMARPWLWISVGMLVLAMGDTVQPLLAIRDAAQFAALLWGLGYALVGSGASIVLDVLDAQGSIALGRPLRPERRAG